MRQTLVRKQCVLCVVTLGGLGRCAVIVLRARDLFGGPARLGPLLLCGGRSPRVSASQPAGRSEAQPPVSARGSPARMPRY